MIYAAYSRRGAAYRCHEAFRYDCVLPAGIVKSHSHGSSIIVTYRQFEPHFVRMDPISITTGILSSFQVVYLTTRFIYNEIMRAKGFRGGKAQMALKYRLEIVRLKTFWVVLTKSTGTTINTKSLNSLSRVSSGVLSLLPTNR